jgi:hypothetical protein
MTTKSPSAAFRRSAAALEKEIAKKRSPKQVNTRKRIGEWESAIADAQRMELLQDRLLALAELWDTGEVPDALQSVTTKSEVETLIRQQAPAIMTIGNPDAGQERPEDTIRKKELALGNIPGFFPTPDAVIQKMLKYMDIQPGDRVLEPSAGRGDLAKAVLKKQPDAIVDCIEWNWNLREILGMKGFNVAGDDIFEYPSTEDYRWVIMNPPFEDAQDARHVRHVYENHLAPGGILVAITSNSIEHNSSQEYEAFREWIGESRARHAALPAGSFQESDNSTGVATCLLVVGKPDAAGNWPAIDWQEVKYVAPEFYSPMWVQHLETGQDARIESITKDGRYQVQFPQSPKDMRENRKVFGVWGHDEVKKSDFDDMRYLMFCVEYTQWLGTLSTYYMWRSLSSIPALSNSGFDPDKNDIHFLNWVYWRVVVARRARKYGDAMNEWFTQEDTTVCYGGSSRDGIEQSMLDDWVNRGLLVCFAEHYTITPEGCNAINKDYSELEPRINEGKELLERHIMAAEVLAEAIAIIRSAPEPVVEDIAPSIPEPIVEEAAAPERVYVPHMETWGIVRASYQDGKLIDVLLDNGIYMQTLRAFTASVESAIYKEDSTKSPLTNREALQIAEAPKMLQLSLF